MSQETLEWLNENTLIGFTEKRGHAWHYREGSDNHYPGAVPVGDVQRKLFDWQPVVIDRPCPCGCGEVSRDISRSDNSHRFGTFTDGYQPHEYSEWLLGAVSNILGDTLSVGSAGLLRKGSVAWVQVEVPENMTTDSGIIYRPNLLATTSLDGSVATTYKRTITNVVCDNTLSAGISEKHDQVFRVKHTRNSVMRLSEAKEALAVISQAAEDFEAEVAALTSTEVSDKQWQAFLDAHVPMPVDKGRGRTMAENKREALSELWSFDERVAPWRGTAWGVLAATNTYLHHKSIVRNADHRAERNMDNAISGITDKRDREALNDLGKVLAAA